MYNVYALSQSFTYQQPLFSLDAASISSRESSKLGLKQSQDINQV